MLIFVKSVSRTRFCLESEMGKYMKQLARIAGGQPPLLHWLQKKRSE